MKNKRKWASILTIATSLILCIISTFGITLAFFGGNASANLSTITLKTGIEIGAAIESSVGSAKVVPGQPVKIEATGTIEVTDKGAPTEANAVDGVVRAKLTVGDELGDVEISGESDYWTAGGDGYYYLVTEDEGTTLRVVKVGDSVKLFGNLTVSKNFTNADSGKSVAASVIFEVIQAGVYDSVNGGLVEMTVANATSASSPLYSSFKAVEYVEVIQIPMYGKGVTTAYYNEENIISVSDSFSISPYAIVGDANATYVYYGFEVLDGPFVVYGFSSGFYTNHYWASQNLGSEKFEDAYLIQNDSFYVINLNDYGSTVQFAWYPSGIELGTAIIVERITTVSTNFLVSNLSNLEYSLSAGGHGGGSN